MLRMKKFLTFQFPFILWMICILGLSSIPSFPTFKALLSLDKVGHIVMFLILTWLAWRAFHFQDRVEWLRRHALLSGFLFAGFYGGATEIYQMALPNRTADIYDVVANIVGAGIFFVWRVYRRRSAGQASGS